MHSLTTERLGQRFGSRILFRKMNIAFHSGHSTAIVGSNGSGKSTLVRILAGLMRPTKGEVILNVDGNEVEGEWRPLSKENVEVTSLESSVPGHGVRELGG